MFENLLVGLRPPRAAHTARRATRCRPVVEGLDDRTAPAVGVLGSNALPHLHRAAAHHHHHHHRHLIPAPAVLIPAAVFEVQTVPPAQADPVKDPLPATQTLTSGIQGQVRIGPISPIARPGDPNDRPLAGAVISISRVGVREPAITVTSDANGNFSIALAPGDYVLKPLPLQPGQTLPRAAPQTVHVDANTFTTVTIEYDTGIR
jgi:hypothetical protein